MTQDNISRSNTRIEQIEQGVKLLPLMRDNEKEEKDQDRTAAYVAETQPKPTPSSSLRTHNHKYSFEQGFPTSNATPPMIKSTLLFPLILYEKEPGKSSSRMF